MVLCNVGSDNFKQNKVFDFSSEFFWSGCLSALSYIPEFILEV